MSASLSVSSLLGTVGPGTGERLWNVVTLRAGHNTTVVLLGTLFLGLASGTVGAFALLRKRSLVADALSHATLPGIGLAFVIAFALGAQGRTLPVLMLGATVSGVIGVLCVHAITRWSRLTEDTAIAIVLSVFFGAGIVVLSVVQGLSAGNQGGIKSFIYGQTAAMSVADAGFMAGIALLAAVIGVLLLKEFTVVSFDEGFARSSGWPVSTVDLLGMALIVLVTVAGLQAVGLLLIVAMIIVPPAAARFWSDRVGPFVLLSAVLGAMSGLLGAVVSSVLPRKPAGAVIVLAAGALFLISLLFAPRRGALAGAARRMRVRLRVLEDHALRSMAEFAECGGGNDRVSTADLFRACGWSALVGAFALRLLRSKGLIVSSGTHVALTEHGRTRAAAVTRNHRLWERYLIERADIAPSHVDWSADLVEHVLSPELVTRLEASLRAEGRLPSPHALEPRGAAGV